MPEIEFAFLADAADARPGEKFHVLGGGVSRLGAHAFPFRHPHLALVVGLLVTSPELETEHDVRFVLLAPDGSEIASANGLIAAHGLRDGRATVVTFAIDLWNLGFNVPGDHSLRLLVNGSERKRISLIVERIVAPTGKVHRLTASVFVDGTYRLLPKGEKEYVPRSPEEMQKFTV